ncbi:MAG TPA: ATP-binding protein [Longimicrobium sp.]|uniref:ATP-binding protein n=1 Tax=Longimicrobium sp. TaxID=2029185 RepID=UPI002EDA56F9
MTNDELVSLITNLREFRTDLVHVEAKRARTEMPKRLWETISAFSNTPGGGVLILGLDESAGFGITGVDDPRKVMQDLGSLCGDMEPPVRAHIELHRVEGATLVVAEIPEAELGRKPVYYPGAGLTNGAFIRVADGDRKLNQYEVQVMLASRGQPRDDEQPVAEATPDDLDQELVAGLLERMRRSERSVFRGRTDQEALRTLKVLVVHQERWVPSLGGLLALGAYPQQFFSELGVTFVAYPTPRLGEPGPRGERFLDQGRFDGPVPRMLEPVMKALQRNMKRRAIVRGLFREDLWEYPETALREALVNALVHRDLSALARGTPVQVRMFPDRLEIVNPGGLFGPVTVERLGDEGISSSRNQLLMKLLEDVPVPGTSDVVCENRGSGIGAMLASLRQAGMSPPHFADRIATFQLTFPNHTLLDAETLRWLESVDGSDLTDSQRMALALLKRGEQVTNASYRQVSGLDSRVATRELGDLVSRGLVDQDGTGRWTTYRLSVNAGDDLAATPSRRKRADRRSAILALFRHARELSRAEIAEQLGISNESAGRWIARLRSEKIVEGTTHSPRDPNARYRLAQPRIRASSPRSSQAS